jgi:hypothetical protein
MLILYEEYNLMKARSREKNWGRKMAGHTKWSTAKHTS